VPLYIFIYVVFIIWPAIAHIQKYEARKSIVLTFKHVICELLPMSSYSQERSTRCSRSTSLRLDWSAFVF
jgi:hypothetical protein